MEFLDTAVQESDLAVGESRCLVLGAAKVGLFRTPEGLFAIDNECPHKGAPLNDGWVREGKVTCPWHQWDFDLADGHCVNIPKVRVASHAVEVRDGKIWISLEDQGARKK